MTNVSDAKLETIAVLAAHALNRGVVSHIGISFTPEEALSLVAEVRAARDATAPDRTCGTCGHSRPDVNGATVTCSEVRVLLRVSSPGVTEALHLISSVDGPAWPCRLWCPR